MSDSIYGTVFYASTGLHGIHVIMGTLAIFMGLVRLCNYQLTDAHHQGHEAGITY